MCGVEGFRQRNGERYAETHHLLALAHGGSLESFNVAVLCANCHRQLHFAEAVVADVSGGYRVTVAGKSFTVGKN